MRRRARFAVSFPESIISLILVTSHFGGKNHIPTPKDALALMMASPTETISKDQALEMRLKVGHSEVFLKNQREIIDQTLRWRELYPPTDKSRLNQFRAALGVDLENDIERITAPTLILQGSKDEIVIPKNAELLKNKIPNSQIHYVEDAPHWVIIENYEECNRVFLEFLDSNS